METIKWLSRQIIETDNLDNAHEIALKIGEQVSDLIKMYESRMQTLTGEQTYAFSGEQRQEIEHDSTVSKSLLTGEQPAIHTEIEDIESNSNKAVTHITEVNLRTEELTS